MTFKRSILFSALAFAGVFGLHMADQATAGASQPGADTTGKKKEKPKVKVQLQDGREVEFPEETKAKKSFIYVSAADGKHTDEKTSKVGEETKSNGEPIGVRWDFSNGQTRTILLSDLTALSSILGCHGLSQKGGDEYASEKDVDDAVLAFDDLMDRLKKGEWSERREGGGFGGSSVLAKAISEVFGKSMEETRAFLRDLKPAEKMALRQTPELKPTIEKLEAEKAAGGKVDTAALLAKAKAFTQPAPAAAPAA
jgi:hypothetical protein